MRRVGLFPCDAPQECVIEVSIFGPGYGECIVIHVGSGQWIVIDSCISKSQYKPDALIYLEGLGVDFKSSVKAIVATHWHLDHIRGLAQLLALCPSAIFCWADVLTQTEGMAFLAARESKVQSELSGGADEFLKCLRVVADRRLRARRLSVDQIAIEWEENVLAHSLPVQLRALSPSDPQSMEYLAAALGAEDTAARENKNQLSVASLLYIGEGSILLGADLEAGTSDDEGWRAVLANHSSSRRSRICKIPHHGSSNAHHEGVWNDMLVPNPLTVLTPWSRGASPLPKNDDLMRIAELSERSFLTSKGTATLKNELDSRLFKRLRETGVDIKKAVNEPGLVRIRFPASDIDNLSVEKFGSAEELDVSEK